MAASGDLAVLHLVCEFVPPNPSLERTAAAVYFTCGRASRVRHHGRSTALRSAARGFRSIKKCVPAFRQAVTPRRQQWQVRGVSW